MNPSGDDPIRILKDQEQDTSPDFLTRVRNRIYRRSATAQLVSYSWHVPKIVLIEMASMLNHILTAIGGTGDRKR